MRIIVNEKQYKRLLKNQHNTKKYISEWVNYVEDMLYPYLNEVTEEDTFTIKNLRNKIGKTNFFKELQIENINVNLLKGNKDKVYLGEVYNEGRVVKDLELDVYVSDVNKRADNFLQEFIKLNNKILLNEQNRLVIPDNVWDKLNDGEIYNTLEKEELIDSLHRIDMDIYDFTGKSMVVKDVNKSNNTIIIQNPNFTEEQISLLLNRDGVMTDYWDMRLNDDGDIEIKIRPYGESYGSTEVGGFYTDTILVEPEDHNHDHDEETDDEETDDEETDDEETGDDEIVVIDPNDMDNTFIKPSDYFGGGRDYGWRDKISSLCRKGKDRYCDWHWHNGEDYPYSVGTEIYVLKPGKVKEKDGHILTIEHTDKSKTRYVHCKKYFVDVGDKIKPGTLIGTVGNEGGSTGPHLHFEYMAPDATYSTKKVIKKSHKTKKLSQFTNRNNSSNPKEIEDDYIRFKKK